MFHSTVATFCAPSDISGVYGMQHKHIWVTSSWKNGPAQYDCIYINLDPEIEGIQGLEIAHVFLFFFF